MTVRQLKEVLASLPEDRKVCVLDQVSIGINLLDAQDGVAYINGEDFFFLYPVKKSLTVIQEINN